MEGNYALYTLKKQSKIKIKSRQNKIIKIAVCVCSDGIDSTVAAAIASQEGYEMYFFHASYGQRAERKEKVVDKKKPCGLTVYNRKAYIHPH